MRIALTIAGSDSGGGAGIQADLKTFQRFGVFGTSAITAITAQNTRGVSRWDAVSAELVRAQIDSVAEDLVPSAFKTGMLGNAADVLLESDAIEVIRRELLPRATLVTPNLHEAGILSGERVEDEDAMTRAAEILVDDMGARAVLIKGGHLNSGDRVVDILYDGDVRSFRGQRLSTTNTHGTGCTLSAAITAQLAKGESLHAAVRRAIDYVHNAIASAPGLGSGHGPLNHLAADG